MAFKRSAVRFRLAPPPLSKADNPSYVFIAAPLAWASANAPMTASNRAAERVNISADWSSVLETCFPEEHGRYFEPMIIGATPASADAATLILNGTIRL